MQRVVIGLPRPRSAALLAILLAVGSTPAYADPEIPQQLPVPTGGLLINVAGFAHDVVQAGCMQVGDIDPGTATCPDILEYVLDQGCPVGPNLPDIIDCVEGFACLDFEYYAIVEKKIVAERIMGHQEVIAAGLGLYRSGLADDDSFAPGAGYYRVWLYGAGTCDVAERLVDRDPDVPEDWLTRWLTE